MVVLEESYQWAQWQGIWKYIVRKEWKEKKISYKNLPKKFLPKKLLQKTKFKNY